MLHVARPYLEFRKDIAFAELIDLVEIRSLDQQIARVFRYPRVAIQKLCDALSEIGQPDRTVALTGSRRKLQEDLVEVDSDLPYLFLDVTMDAIQRQSTTMLYGTCTC